MGSGWGYIYIYIYICIYMYIYIWDGDRMGLPGDGEREKCQAWQAWKSTHEIYGGLWVLQQATMTPSGIPIYPLVNIQKTMENHNFQWANKLFLWPFSIAMLVYQRVLHF